VSKWFCNIPYRPPAAMPDSVAGLSRTDAFLLRCTLVASGTKRHFTATQQTVAFGGKADIAEPFGMSANDL
jgi:hypothetical protein